MSKNIQGLILISKKLRQLKLWFRALTVNSHKIWAQLYSSHDKMNIKNINLMFWYHITYNLLLLVFAAVKLHLSVIITFHSGLHQAVHPAKNLPFFLEVGENLKISLLFGAI